MRINFNEIVQVNNDHEHQVSFQITDPRGYVVCCEAYAIQIKLEHATKCPPGQCLGHKVLEMD